MKKGSFDLTRKAIDCRELLEMGDAGKEIFRALKLALGCEHDDEIDFYSLGQYSSLGLLQGRTMEFDMWEIEATISEGFELLQPLDVLGQSRIDAAKDGATLIFEGDEAPRGLTMICYRYDGSQLEPKTTPLDYPLINDERVVAYKLIEEKQPPIESRILAEKVGAKHDTGKPLYNLIPVHAEAEFVDVLTFGANKYAPDQWRNVENGRERYIAAAMRHFASYRMGETHDPESRKHPLAHAMCCLAFIIEMDLEQNK